MLLTCSSFIATIGLSIGLGYLTVFIWDITPPEWTCEYGQSPTSKHKKTNRRVQFYTAPFCSIFLIFILQSFLYGLPLHILFLYIILLFSLLQLSISDIVFQILPDEWIILIAIVAPLFPGDCTTKLQGIILPALGYLLLSVSQYILHTPPVIGAGDIKLITALGFYFGIAGLTFILCYAFLAAGVWAGILIICRKAKKRDRIAFGPFLSISCFYFAFSTLSM